MTLLPQESSYSAGSALRLFVARTMRSRVVLLALAGMTIAGLFLSWPWLSALGLAPLILMMAPCAVMCAFGACAMRGRGHGKDDSATAATKPRE